MDAIKIYIKVHIKYWIYYVFTTFTMALSFRIGLFIIIYFGFTNKDQRTSEYLAHMLFSVLGSLPLIVPNYKASIKISETYKYSWYLCFILCQSISIVIYAILFIPYVFLTFGMGQ